MEKSKQKMSANPRENANIFSILTFWWTIALFKKGYRKVLGQEDLFRPLKEDTSQSLGDRLDRQWAVRKSLQSRTRLIRAIVRTFWWEITRLGIIQVLNEVVIRLGQPLLLGRLLEAFRNGSDKTRDEALMCAGGIVILNALSVLTINQFTLGGFHLGMKVRVAVCSIIYRKALRLSRIALGDTAPGKVVNLLSNDVNRFDMLSIFLHFMWSSPLMGLVVTYLLWTEIGLPGVFGVIVVFLVVPIQSYTGKLSSRFRLQTALKTDERVRLMDEVISGVQVIKMYAWEKPYSALVAMARKLELRIVRKNSYVRGLYMTFMLFTTRMALFCTMLAIVLMGGQLTAAKVFVVSSYFNILAHTMSQMFVRGFAELAEAWVAMNRLQRFLDYDEFQNKKSPLAEMSSNEKISSTLINEQKLNGNGNVLDMNLKNQMNIIGDYQQIPLDNGENVVKLTNILASWTNDPTNEPTLNGISLEIPKGKLIGVIGSVGAGKSSLLQLLLGELPVATGDMTVLGKASYACQEPWVFASSVRQNILFGQPYEKARYNDVIRCCALQRDFEQLPDGDLTIVGERGASLSGGQRARVSLARAVYRRADLYLLDDPLSAVDAHVGRHLFDQCISGYLKHEAVILVTHQLQYLKQADEIIILSNGHVEARGTYSQLSSSGLDFARLLAESSEHQDPNEASSMPGSRRSSASSAHGRHQSLQSVHSIDESRGNDDPQEVEETRASGTIGAKTYGEYMKSGAGICVLFILFSSLVLAQIAASASDYFLTFWVNLEESRNTTFIKESNRSAEIVTDPTPLSNEDDFWDLSRDTCIYVYTAITVATVVITLGRSYLFFSICMKASMKLHNLMFSGITRATMYFFNTNPSGRILNRFSKDMGSIDELLPAAMIDCLQIGLSLLGIIIVVAVVNYWLLIPTVLVGYLFYLLRNFYLATSRSVKRLEGTTRSPVFSHLSASLAGLPTIRAFGAQKELIQEFDNHQDLHSSAWYIFLASSRAFGFWLDLICVVYIAVVTLSFLVLGNENFGGNVGLAITQAIGLTGMFQWGMRQSAELENQMTSVERVLEYRSIQPEPALESDPKKKPPPTWPEKGKIVFKDLSLRYGPEEPFVLKKLNFEIKPSEKVGIVGRTGAGKSSLINAMFRLSYIDGTIILDDRDTADMGLHDLRSKVSIIPQEPVLFSGTMRYNLDPFDEYPDSALWQALSEVELKEAVMELPAGLSGKMSEGGTNFSVGQRQLVCLARAILRNNKVLVLDEATANVDPQTDALIQTTIRHKFSACTVLTIAHRLNTVMDCDKVLVMDAGQVLEFGHPHELLQNSEGTFRSMVAQTGPDMLDALTKVAEQSYEKQIQQD